MSLPPENLPFESSSQATVDLPVDVHTDLPVSCAGKARFGSEGLKGDLLRLEKPALCLVLLRFQKRSEIQVFGIR